MTEAIPSYCASCGSTRVHPFFMRIEHKESCSTSGPRSIGRTYLPTPKMEIKTMSVDGLIIRACKIASEAHRSQKRRYSNDPYILHPMRVAGRVTLLMNAGPVEIAASWLHDVLEDSGMKEKDLEDRGMPKEVIDYVVALTNPSSRMDKTVPRAQRKVKDIEHLAKQNTWVKKIKLIDRLDNLIELSWDDISFMDLYCQETKLLVDAIGDADKEIADELKALVNFYEEEIDKLNAEEVKQSGGNS